MASDTIQLSRTFPGPVARVFAAWSDPLLLARWAWGSIGVDAHAEVDFRVGGGFRVTTARPDGTRWAYIGVYTAIEPLRRIEHDARWNAPMGYESDSERVSIEFHAEPAGTRVVFTHSGVPSESARAEHARGWADTFDALARVLA
jgi:uncharacterized protein YndB with AHSA1/START domain